MQITYTPEGAEPRTWDFKPEKLMSPESEAIERHTGWTYTEFVEAFYKGSTLAKHAVLFVLLKRAAPTLKWDEVQFAMDEVKAEPTLVELNMYREAMEAQGASRELNESEQDTLDSIRGEIARREADDPKDEPEASLPPESGSESDTSSS